MQNEKITEKVRWFYNGKSYNTRREITDKFGWPTCIWNAKRRDKEIIKLIIKDTSDENKQDVHSNS